MTFMRNIYRQKWCRTCRNLTPHDEHGTGLCMHCVWDIQDWLTTQEAPVPTSSTTVTNEDPTPGTMTMASSRPIDVEDIKAWLADTNGIRESKS